jgi:transcriptional regulator with XRE-family HTH domain
MKVGDNIKKLRELRNYTQQYLADQLEISLSGYGKIERNETDVSLSRLQQIADILGIDIHGILRFDDKHLFNLNNNEVANGQVNNYYSGREELLERIIEQLRKENENLLSIIELMRTHFRKDT